MSLYESQDSIGKASLQQMLNGTLENQINSKITLEQLANLIIRGGWPSNLKVPEDKIGIIPKSYIEAILDKDMNDDKVRDKGKMTMLLKSLARNEATIVSNSKLMKDMNEIENSKDRIESRITIDDYLNVLNRLHIIENQLRTFGFMFEAMVERDLRIYIETLGGKLFHFRDNVTGLEVDSILEFSDGKYAAVEIKLGFNQLEEAKKSLLNFYNNLQH